MLQKYKHSLYLFIFTIIITAILSFFVEGNTILIRFINGAFYLALLYTIIGGFLYLAEKGFFNIIKYGFKKMFKKKHSELMGEKVTKEVIYERKSYPITVPLLLNGIGIAVLTLLISFFL